MNLSIIGSFIIGGMLMLSVIFLNVRVSVHSGQETMHVMAKTNVDVISQVLTFDLRKVGYGAGAEITTANATTFSFSTDLNNDGSLNTITWQYFPDEEIATTENPGDRRLVRVLDGETQDFSSMVVTRFELFYILQDGTEVQNPANLSQIRKIRINVICETEFGYDGEFGASAWQNVITPLNINI